MKLFLKREKMDEVALISPNKMAVLPGPLPDGRRSGGDEGLGSRLRAASLRAHGSARCHNNTHAYFVSGWEKEAERDDHFRTAPTENSGPKFKFRLLHSLVKLIAFQNFKPERVNKSEMLQNFSQTQGTVFHSLACISSSEGFFKNRSATFCGKSPSSDACPSQIAVLFSLGLKFLMK